MPDGDNQSVIMFRYLRVNVLGVFTKPVNLQGLTGFLFITATHEPDNIFKVGSGQNQGAFSVTEQRCDHRSLTPWRNTMGITIQARIEVEDGLPATSVEIGIIE